MVEVGDRRLELPAAPAGPFALGRLYGDDVLKIGDVATDVVTLGVEDVKFPPKQLPTGPPPGTLYGPGAVQRHEIRGDLSIP